MSKSFQEFCKRILPAVQAGAEGKRVEYFGELSGEWLKKDSNGFNGDCEYRVSEPKATPLPITPEMWAMIDPKYQWAILTHNHEKKLLTCKPIWLKIGEEEGWHIRLRDQQSLLPLNIDTTGIIPELSLTKRPEQNADNIYTPHYVT